MNDIVIDYAAFTEQSTAYVVMNGLQKTLKVSSDINELAAELVAICHECSIHNIKFTGGAPQDTVQQLKELINDETITIEELE